MQHPTLSFWEKEVFFPSPDVLIIGSGIVGLNAAIRLKELAPSARVMVVERGPLPTGASTRNAGFACFGSPSELLADLQKHGEEEMLTLVEKRWRGLARLRQRLGNGLLDYHSSGGYEVFLPGHEATYQACRDQLDRFNRLLAPVLGDPQVFRPADERLPEFGLSGFAHMIENPHEGQVHPGKMMAALLDLAREKGVHLLSGLDVTRLEPHGKGVEVAFHTGWRLQATRVLVATNGFARRLLPELPVVPARNQVILTRPIPGLALRGCFHMDEGYVYFRNAGERLLIGGFRNLDPEGEQTDQFGFSPHIQEALHEMTARHILAGQRWEIEDQWSGILGVGTQKKPIIAQVAPGIWAAVRLGGMGVAIGTLVGEEAAEEVLRFEFRV